ncbi:MAG: acyclic terpene utilization AtuA family protein [Pseudomonadota bacterium]
MSKTTISVGGASGFWGESAMSTAQLLGDAELDYLVYDYLAEITMSILARARASDPALGYAADFVSAVLAPNIEAIAAKGVRVLSNAGGVNPEACAKAVRALIAERGLDLKVAVVTGDDLTARAAEFADAGVTEMFSGAAFPEVDRLASINAYLGAFPIAAALADGADIVITGRVVDSAVTLAACIHAFGWSADDYDRLAAGSVAGHILECGPQATGGNFTDWEQVADSLHNIGYPIADIDADGDMVIRKPADTGGMVSVGTVAEQLLYEVGDAQAYVLPDVVCDFGALQLEQMGENRVHVSGARGHVPTDTYKVSATYADGWRGGQTLVFYGRDADRKARAFAGAALKRAQAQLDAAGLPGFTDTLIELVGDESHYGARRELAGSREVSLKVAARHPTKAGIGILLRETIGAALAGPPGLTGFAGTRPRPSPVVRLFSFLLDKKSVPVTIDSGDAQHHYTPAGNDSAFDDAVIVRPAPPEVHNDGGPMLLVPLVELAWGRSGDKGDKANIGIIARKAQYLPYIWATLSEAVVGERFEHFTNQPVDRYYLPGMHAINFVLHDVLGGGGIASLRNDPQGKGYAQLLLDIPVRVPERMRPAH